MSTDRIYQRYNTRCDPIHQVSYHLQQRTHHDPSSRHPWTPRQTVESMDLKKEVKRDETSYLHQEKSHWWWKDEGKTLIDQNPTKTEEGRQKDSYWPRKTIERRYISQLCHKYHNSVIYITILSYILQSCQYLLQLWE